ncbi:MAG: serine hydrolase domain-containing protein, partial [Pyrinomonadaceae bacterium]|nr:serine hydrolase domain-containing protein [Pyrinomonadaceae bacterium]
MLPFITIRRISILTALAAASLFLLNVSVAAQRSSLTKQVDRLVAKRMSDTGTPGFAVGVAVNGRVVHRKGYGYANVETGSLATPRTVFSIASVTKTFTAMAAMKLVEQGRLSLDDPLSKHLDDIPAAWRPITIRQLLSNTSGIRSFTSLTPDEQRCNASPVSYTHLRAHETA